MDDGKVDASSGQRDSTASAFDTAPALLQGLAEIEKFLRPLTKVVEGRELRSSAQMQASLALAVSSAQEAALGAVARARISVGVVGDGSTPGSKALIDLCDKVEYVAGVNGGEANEKGGTCLASALEVLGVPVGL